jgi:hypothetical protein
MVMDNKLSELSKPVVYAYRADANKRAKFDIPTSWQFGHSTICDGVAAEPPPLGDEYEYKPLYSQEYVSALQAELEAKDKRITTVTEEREFWRERVEGAEKDREEFRRRFNLERTYTEDADKRIAELEAKLATPVQFPDCDTAAVSIMAHWLSDEEVNAWVKGVEFAKQQIRAAGFPVGDE